MWLQDTTEGFEEDGDKFRISEEVRFKEKIVVSALDFLSLRKSNRRKSSGGFCGQMDKNCLMEKSDVSCKQTGLALKAMTH